MNPPSVEFSTVKSISPLQTTVGTLIGSEAVTFTVRTSPMVAREESKGLSERRQKLAASVLH